MTLSNISANYLGCFRDSLPRYLTIALGNSATNTNENCISRCYAKDYAYSGTEFSKQCFCGNSQGTYAQLSESSCNYACSGNSSQFCGGLWALSLWRLSGAIWSDWSEWTNCTTYVYYYANSSLSSLTEYIYSDDCSILNSVGTSDEQTNAFIEERSNLTAEAITEIVAAKEAALAALNSKYQTSDSIGNIGGSLTIAFISIFIAWIVLSDLLKLLRQLKTITVNSTSFRENKIDIDSSEIEKTSSKRNEASESPVPTVPVPIDVVKFTQTAETQSSQNTAKKPSSLLSRQKELKPFSKISRTGVKLRNKSETASRNVLVSSRASDEGSVKLGSIQIV